MLRFLVILLASLIYIPNLVANADFNIKYSTNYLMPAHVHFQADGKNYQVNAKINIPFYRIQFASKGQQTGDHFEMLHYLDTRNDKPYAVSKITNQTIEYGKLKDGLQQQTIADPTFDLFTLAFQLSYYDRLPLHFQITNGKKLYPMRNVLLKKGSSIVQQNGKQQTEISYRFKTSDGKDIVVKKLEGEKFPRYISYSRDGDNYELTFSEIIQ